MQRSKTAQNAIAELYAIMATAAAKRAVWYVTEYGNTVKADEMAEATIKWLDKSSAQAIGWRYRRPG